MSGGGGCWGQPRRLHNEAPPGAIGRPSSRPGAQGEHFPDRAQHGACVKQAQGDHGTAHFDMGRRPAGYSALACPLGDRKAMGLSARLESQPRRLLRGRGPLAARAPGQRLCSSGAPCPPSRSLCFSVMSAVTPRGGETPGALGRAGEGTRLHAHEAWGVVHSVHQDTVPPLCRGAQAGTHRHTRRSTHHPESSSRVGST